MAVPVLRSPDSPAASPSDDDARRHPLRLDHAEGLVVVERQLWVVPQGPDPVFAWLLTYAHAVKAGRGRRRLRVVRDDDLAQLGHLTGEAPQRLADRLRQLA